jgi:choice-of-anchor B domain-containing protein
MRSQHRLVPLLFAAAAVAQGYQCTLLGTQNLHPPYNGVWGYVAPNGKEYALLGSELGVAIIDCTNPSAPIERGWFPGVDNPWRELRTWSHYVYVTTEGAGGFQVINMLNPDAPVDLGIVNTQYYNNAHALGLDMGTGRIYITGTNNGTAVFDAAVNPASPAFLGFAQGSGSANYVHDVHVENGYGYVAMISAGLFRIWDVSTFPPTTLSTVTTPSAFCHNAWPTANGNITVTTDERDGSVVRFYDTTNKSSPVPLSQISVNQDSVPHNAYIIGNLSHTSWYTEGYQCIDFSDPLTPVVVASYDTFPGPSGGYSGAWGCFPYLPSGNVYISDRSTGLYVLRPQLTNLAIAHTPIVDTTNEDGPYTVTANLTSSNPITSATLRYRISGGAQQTVAMTATATPGQYTANIPGQNAAVQIDYQIQAVDSVAERFSPRIGEHRFLVGTRVSRYLDTFEGASTWTSGGTASDWQFGAPTGRAGSSLSLGWQDPIRAASGNNIWGTDIGLGGANGAYAANQNSFLQSPAIPTNGVQRLRLRFKRFLSVVTGDTARLLVNGNLIFTSSSNYDTRWQTVEYDVASILNTASTATIRFELTTSANNSAGGWNVDDVELFTLHDAAPPLVYGVGTPGTSNVVPVLALPVPAVLGTTTQIQGSSMLANSFALLALNLASANLPAVGVTVLVDPTAVALLGAPISGTGTASWPFGTPPTLSLDNIYLYAQALPLDPGSPGGLFAASAGLRFRTCVSAP